MMDPHVVLFFNYFENIINDKVQPSFEKVACIDFHVVMTEMASITISIFW